MSSCALATRAAPSFGKASSRARQQLQARLAPLPRRLPKHQRELINPSASAVDSSLLDVAAFANARNLVAEAAGSSEHNYDTDTAASDAPYGLSVVDSTDDAFEEFCAAQVELVAHALGRGARCMLYLRSQSGEEGSLQLAEVASYPPSSPREWSSSQEDDDHHDADDGEYDNGSSNGGGGGGYSNNTTVAAAAESFAFAEERQRGREFGARAGAGGGGGVGPGQAITLSGGGSVDDSGGHGGQVTAAEALLVKQR